MFTAPAVLKALAEMVRVDVREFFVGGQMRPIGSLTLAQANMIDRITVVRRKRDLILKVTLVNRVKALAMAMKYFSLLGEQPRVAGEGSLGDEQVTDEALMARVEAILAKAKARHD
jgi:hypothetical protein